MKEKMDWKKVWKYFVCGILLLFLVIGVPVIINELYKLDCGYLTIWDGADVLGYYGTLLGAVIAILGVIATIWSLKRTIEFTRKQIRHDRYILTETEKWNKIEKLFTVVIQATQPLNLLNLYSEKMDTERNYTICSELSKFINDANISYDNLYGSVEMKDHEKVGLLLTLLRNNIDKLTEYSAEITRNLSEFFVFRALVQSSNGKEDAIRYAFIITQSKKFTNDFEGIKIKLEELRKNDYVKLLQYKRECFDTIYRSIEEEAEKILK